MRTFQKRRLLSSLTDARVSPSGEKASHLTPWVWPLQTPRSFPLWVSHKRMAFSVSAMGLDPAARMPPSSDSASGVPKPKSAATGNSALSDRVVGFHSLIDRS